MTTLEAPAFTLQHVEGHQVSLQDYRGGKVVVVLSAKDTAGQAQQAAKTLRQRFDHEELPILLVIDLSRLPRMIQRVAKSMIKKGYAGAVERARADYAAQGRPFPADASQAVVMLPDLDGSVTASFAVGDVRQAAAAVLIDEAGKVVGTASGEAMGDEVLALLD